MAPHKILPLLLCFLSAFHLPAQAPEMPGHIRLRVLPPFAKDFDSLPRLVPNEAVTAVQAAVLNARLAALDAAARKERAACRALARTESHFDYERAISITMRGPRWLSLSIASAYDCGGAHPSNDSIGYTFDVTTGKPINWTQALPQASLEDPTRRYGESAILWPPLGKRGTALAEPDCQELYREPAISFSLWLDGDRGALIATPASFPHVVQACAIEIALDPANLRTLHVRPDVIDALTTARSDPSAEAIKRRTAAAAPKKD